MMLNPDNEESIDNAQIKGTLMIIEVTGYSFEYIQNLPLPQYKELLHYCTLRIAETRAMAKALGVNIDEEL